MRYSTYLSYALTDLGELQRAKAVVAEVFASAGEVADRYTRVRLYWSLGRLALEQAQPFAALDNFRRAVALLEATEDTVHLARAHIACADATITAGDDLGGALQHLDEAERLLGARPTTTTSRSSAGCRRCARPPPETAPAPSISVSRPSRSAPSFPTSAATPGGRSPRRAPAAARGAPTTPTARRPRCSAEHGTVRQQANVLRSYGRFLRESGREREALDVFERAADVASNLQVEAASAER